MKRIIYYISLVTILVGIYSITIIAQDLRATAFEVKKDGEYFGG